MKDMKTRFTLTAHFSVWQRNTSTSPQPFQGLQKRKKMNIKRNVKSIMILNLSALIFLLNSFLFAQENQTKKILILNSYHKGFVQTDNIVKGIESILEPQKNSINLIIEYMDSKAIEYGTQYKEKLYDFYNYKYGNQKFDLIISSDDNAFDFLREYHENLFPDTPIVFCGVYNLEAPNLIDHNIFTGILEVQSVRETIDLALSLHPKTRKIVFIVDDTPTGLYFWSVVQELFKYYEDIQMIRFDSSLSLAQIENKVSKLSDDTILYFGTFHRDKTGNYYSFDEAVSRVSKASAQPIYGGSVQILPYCIGGKLFGGFYHGQITAELAQRILKGEKVRDIPVITEPQTQYMFNYEQMQRFGINTSNLPEGSIIINKPSSFYEENKILIWSTIAFIALQMLIIIIILIMNITKRREAEKALRNNEIKYRTLVEHLPAITYTATLDESSTTLYVSPQIEKILGISPEGYKADPDFWVKHLHDEDRERVLEEFEHAHETGQPLFTEYRMISKDGRIVWIRDDAVIVKDEKENPLYLQGIMFDITDRKQSEEALRESETQYKNLYSMMRLMNDNLPDLIWTKDLEGKFLFVNKACSKILLDAKDTAEPIGKTDIYFAQRGIDSHPGIPDYFTFGQMCTDSDLAVLNSKKPLRFDESGNVRGEFLFLDVYKAPFKDENGNLIGTVGCARVVTQERQMEQELQKHREHLEELIKERTAKLEKSQQSLALLLADVNESRTELDVSNKKLESSNKELEAFAYSVSHDLRAPLRSIDGFSQILLEDYSGILDKQGQHYLQRVRTGTQNMGRLIDDILSLSRSGRHQINKKTINMEPIVREVCKSLENELKDRKVVFTVHECPPALADAHLVKIVFTNLLSNALKFTRIRENAKIETGSMTEDGNTVFFIKDNGAGFDMKYADKLFVPFQRLHRAEEYEGSGIGLAIVQRIIHRHGGRIWAESEIDVGTTFYFSLPRS